MRYALFTTPPPLLRSALLKPLNVALLATIAFIAMHNVASADSTLARRDFQAPSSYWGAIHCGKGKCKDAIANALFFLENGRVLSFLTQGEKPFPHQPVVGRWKYEPKEQKVFLDFGNKTPGKWYRVLDSSTLRQLDPNGKEIRMPGYTQFQLVRTDE